MTKPGVDRKITMLELEAHNTASEPWFVVQGEVYDGSGFLKKHPGGAESITLVAGEDATEDFMAIHSIVSCIRISSGRNMSSALSCRMQNFNWPNTILGHSSQLLARQTHHHHQSAPLKIHPQTRYSYTPRNGSQPHWYRSTRSTTIRATTGSRSRAQTRRSVCPRASTFTRVCGARLLQKAKRNWRMAKRWSCRASWFNAPIRQCRTKRPKVSWTF